jgi:aerotaxis receptor
MARQADAVADAVGRVGGNAGAASAAADQALHTVQAVAAASEELASSIREITRQAALAGDVAQRAVAGGRRSEETIRSLSEAVARIGAVAGLIGDIAGQTNLLALNATIEAARAGDAGKGFAVVAGEVKNLATQTARSTEEITRQIAEIQSVTGAAVEAVAGIGKTIAEISEVATAIAAAMEEQSAATQEIARNVADTSGAVRDIAQRISDVSGDVGRAGEVAAGVREGSGAVDESVGALQAALVKVVRTSMKEADRRVEPRFTIAEPCAVEVAGRRLQGMLVSISGRGALVSGIPALAVGTRGTLALPGRGGASCTFEARVTDSRGIAMVLDEASLGPPWRRAFEALTGARIEADAA